MKGLKCKLNRRPSKHKMVISLMKRPKSKRRRKKRILIFYLKYQIKRVILRFLRSGKTDQLERTSKEM